MTTIDDLLDGRATVRESARDFIEDPLSFFDMSHTKMQSVPRNVLEELQTEALAMRFEEQKERIPALAKLADRQGITRVTEFNEVIPVCFEHTIYKSYPAYLLEKGQFGKMTSWMNKLTSHDLGDFDASGCESIHSWLDQLCARTDLDPVASSGTTGTMSFTPRDKKDWRTQVLGGLRIQMLQKFGEAPTDDDFNDKLHVVWTTHGDGHTSPFRLAHYLYEYMALGCKDHFHPMFESAGDTDVMWLAARLRAAQIRGDDRVDVPEHLLARRDELEAMERDRVARADDWLESMIHDMEGKRVYVMGPWVQLYDIAKRGLAEGKTCHFATNSIVQTGGGGKGLVMPDDWVDVAKSFYNTEFKWMYGYSELTALHARCEYHRYHIAPWAIPLLLDAETSEPLPREGVQVGRATFFDLAASGVWGGCISGDKIEIDWNPCPCGRTTAHIADDIKRFSEEQGGTDKITCVATPEAHTEALDFITSF